MAAKRKKSTSVLASLTRRTGIVWAVFLGAMTIVTAFLLAMQDGPAHSGFLLTSVEVVGNKKPGNDSIFQIAKPVDSSRWTSL